MVLILIGMTGMLQATDITQTIRGTVIDLDSKEVLTGVTIVLLDYL